MLFHKAPKHVPLLHLQINNNEISYGKIKIYWVYK